MTFTVTEKAQRPARMDGTCFYCLVKIGDQHKPDCVQIRKMVKVQVTITYDYKCAAHFTSEDVDFQLNDSSWCASNMMEDLEKIIADRGCLCSVTEFECLDDKGDVFLDE